MPLLQNRISVRGFVAEPNHPSGLRFPIIERAAEKVFSSESDCDVTIRNTMNNGEAELYIVAGNGARYCVLFDLDGLATADMANLERWWEGAISSAWERARLRQVTEAYGN